MGPNSLPPMVAPKRSMNVWVIVALVFAAGLGAGVVLPSGMTLVGLGESPAVSNKKEPLTMPLPNGRLRRVDPPISNQPVTETVVAKVEKAEKVEKVQKVDKVKTKLAANTKKHKKNDKIEKAVAKLEKEKAPAKVEKIAKVEEAPAPSADLIEEVPSAPSVLQVEKMIQNNQMANKGKAMVRQVSLPPSQAMGTTSLAAHASPLPMLKTDPRGEGKTYPVSINNASFSKANLNGCSKRCALLVMDAMGNPVKAVFDGAAYASALMQHNGTINISGQPRIIKNQQVLVVENITFNLSAGPKTVAGGKRARTVAAPTGAAEKGGYTEVSFENDDLKPGTVIRNRKQIPIEEQQEIPTP